MNTTANEVLDFVRDNDVKFVRLSFCDILGHQKNISLISDGLQDAFENGVSFDAHAIRGFRNVKQSDLLLFPDPATLMVLPWRPGSGRVARFYCDLKNPDGSVFANDARSILKRVIQRAEEMGFICKVGAECEFYLFKTDEDGEPTDRTFDKGGYLDLAPLDRGEDIRREICLTLEEMGIKPETSHHEQGPGQNEIDFKFSGALECADNLQSFKSAVKAIAARNGLFASFMPKPIPRSPGSGMHVNISLVQNGRNIFEGIGEGSSSIAESFIAGILDKTYEITAFLNPIPNSYKRFGEFEAPRYISWSHQNRSQLVRIPAAVGEKIRMELRSPDPALNPYLAFALIISAGLDGIEDGMVLPAPVDEDLYTVDESVTKELTSLPYNLEMALEASGKSDFIERVVGQDLLVRYITVKKAEIADFAAAEDKSSFYRERYFSII